MEGLRRPLLVEFRFTDDELLRLYTEADFKGSFPPEVVEAFRRRMQQIVAAEDERAFYALKSLHFEKLHARGSQRSMRLNKQWRLIVEIEKGTPKNTLLIVAIEDYH